MLSFFLPVQKNVITSNRIAFTATLANARKSTPQKNHEHNSAANDDIELSNNHIIGSSSKFEPPSVKVQTQQQKLHFMLNKVIEQDIISFCHQVLYLLTYWILPHCCDCIERRVFGYKM